MKVVRDCPEARHLPTRHNLALFRLLAALRVPSPRPRGEGGRRPDGGRCTFTIDRHQSNVETFTVAAIAWIVSSAYVAHALSSLLPLAAALLIGLVMSPLVMQLPMFVSGIVGRNRVELNSIVLMALLTLASAYYATAQAWVRWPARGFLALVVANAAAAPIAWLLRGRFAEMESRCAG